MLAYRLVRTRHLTTPLDGEGARLFGARWNPPGWRVVYLADHPATAILETLVHLANPALAATDYHLLAVDVPERLIVVADEIDVASLPPDWRDVNSLACQQAGLAWLTAVPHVAVCRVPSAVVPGSRNLLVDPAHPEAALVHVVDQQPFRFDPRLIP